MATYSFDSIIVIVPDVLLYLMPVGKVRVNTLLGIYTINLYLTPESCKLILA